MEETNELEKLRELLDQNNIEYINKSVVKENDGIDIEYKNFDISVISHPFSYGGNSGLLEIMASFIDGEVKGYLTANDVIDLILTSGGK